MPPPSHRRERLAPWCNRPPWFKPSCLEEDHKGRPDRRVPPVPQARRAPPGRKDLLGRKVRRANQD